MSVNWADEFVVAYVACALWSSMDESDPETGGDPLDYNYAICDLSESARVSMLKDCVKFLDDDEIVACVEDQHSQAGHDFWLTRNGHGAGFWDGDWPEPCASRLDSCAKAFGECDLYVGDDGLIYVM